MKVFLAFIGIYEERHCIGVFKNEPDAVSKIESTEDWKSELKQYEFLRTINAKQPKPIHDIEEWLVTE